MTFIDTNQTTVPAERNIFPVSGLQWRIKADYCLRWLGVPTRRTPHCQRLQHNCCVVLHMRAVMVSSRDLDAAENRWVRRTRVIIHRQIAQYENYRDDKDCSPHLRDSFWRDS